MLSYFSCVPALCDATDCSLPGCSVYGIFSRQEYWSGLPCPSPGDLPNPGIEPVASALQADSLLSVPPGKTSKSVYMVLSFSCKFLH